MSEVIAMLREQQARGVKLSPKALKLLGEAPAVSVPEATPAVTGPPVAKRTRKVRMVRGEPVKARDTHRAIAVTKELTAKPVPKAERRARKGKLASPAPPLPPGPPKAAASTRVAFGSPEGRKGSSAARHDWLEAARQWCVTFMAGRGCAVPDTVRVTVGFPWKSRKAVGQCWQPDSVTDKQGEILVSPVLDDPLKILATLIHELVHAATPGAKHGPAFKAHAVACGLTGKMTATVMSDDLKAILTDYVKEAGPYPAGSITVAGLAQAPKQTTRYIKCQCDECGYVCRASRQWINRVGAPHCPAHGAMKASLPE